MKTIKFKPHLIDLILKGEKHSTFRLFDDKDLQVGDIVVFLNSETKEEFAKAKLVKVWQKTLGSLEETDFEGHNPYSSTAEAVEKYKGYYGDKVNKHTVVKIIHFKLI